VRRAAFVAEGVTVLGEHSRVSAAQQEVFPFLHLLLEFDLRDACRVGGLRILTERLCGLDLQRMRIRQCVPAFQTHHHRCGEQHRAEQRQLHGDLQISIERHSDFL
jgi:hypothetical protein